MNNNHSNGIGKNEDNPFEIIARRYGKSYVRMLHRQIKDDVHYIKEFEINTFLKLSSDRDYLEGDNSDVVATDSQKNIVYWLAKNHGVESPEAFGSIITDHFLKKYEGNIVEAFAEVVEYNTWKRIKGQHKHAFIAEDRMVRTAKVTQKANFLPQIISGIQNLQVLKSTKSYFKDFIKDEYTTLPYVEDRIFSTVIEAEWDYEPHQSPKKIPFDETHDKVKNAIYDNFAGDASEGINSPSVQMTLYQTERDILKSEPYIRKIWMKMPNKHYFAVDFEKLPCTTGEPTGYDKVFLPVDKPSGVIECSVGRK